MARRVSLTLLVVLLVVLAGYLYFAHLARIGLERGINSWAQHQRARGWIVAMQIARPAVLIPGIELRNVLIQGGNDVLHGGFAVGADQAKLRIDLLNPSELHVLFHNAVTLRVASGTPVTFTGDDAKVTVTVHDAKVTAVAFDAKNLRTIAPAGYTVGTLNSSVTLADQGAHFGIRSEAVTIPENVAGLGQHLSDVTIDADLTGWPPSAGSRAARADVWRASGGKIDITKLMVGWGPLGLVGQGEFRLDPSLQPDANGTLQVRGYDQVLRALGNNGALVADVLSVVEPGDVATLQLRVKKDSLLVDRVRVAKFHRLEW